MNTTSSSNDAALISPLCEALEPSGRIVFPGHDPSDWTTWGCSPIDGPDGKVHLFCSHWRNPNGRPRNYAQGWQTASEIWHCVGDDGIGPFELMGDAPALTGRGPGYWDEFSAHSPAIHKVAERYALLYTSGSSSQAQDLDDWPRTQRIGLAMAETLDGPFERVGDEPILSPSADPDAWDSHLVTDPALLAHPNGQFWLYYKAWQPETKQCKKMGLAVADRIEGPYRRHEANPVVDFSGSGKGVEDAYAYISEGTFYLLMADDNGGIIKLHGGVLMSSRDGVRFGNAQLGYDSSDVYYGGTVQSFERPQVLLRDGRPAFVYAALTNPNGNPTSSVFRVSAARYMAARARAGHRDTRELTLEAAPPLRPAAPD